MNLMMNIYIIVMKHVQVVLNKKHRYYILLKK